MSPTFPPWPHFDPDEVEAAAAVLRSGKVNYWTGDECKAFEREFASFHGRRHGISMANGTVTLEAALHALGIGPGDEVVVPSRTFIATASCVVAVGARPVVCDIDPASGNMTAEAVDSVRSQRTKAIIPVHVGGWPCEMDALEDLAADHGLALLEDCAQSHGATYRGKLTGSFGPFSSFSFCQDKIMTTGGEGGMLLTDDDALMKKTWSRKDHGKGYDTTFNKQHPPGFRWLHESFGTNDRMTEMQAAIGRRQLQKLPHWMARRTANARRLATVLKAGGLRVPLPPAHMQSAWYKLYAYTDAEALRPGWDRDRVMAELNRRGIPVTVGSCAEIYREKAFMGAGFTPAKRMPNAQRIGESSLMFQVHPTIGDADIDRVAGVAHDVLAEAVR